MYKKSRMTKTSVKSVDFYEGETIEEKVRRFMDSKEPISDGAPLVYTERKDGVLAAYDVRTDRFEVAIDAMEKIQKSHQAKREERMKTPEQKEAEKVAKEAKEGMKKEGEGRVAEN